ncbi:MAG TPA: hypothetical protein VFR03_11415 [Thermoanaerobaculia bacterium]|nr:hypothetical protein [Thermoanaerobaculia bacterium]
METPNLERIRFITRHFNDLQGLRYGVPLGLVLLSWGGPPLLRAAGLVGALLLALGSRRYYRSTFGAVERQPADLDTELSVFSPAGPIPRLAMPPRVPPVARRFFLTSLLAVTVFAYVLALPPGMFIVQGDASYPRLLPQTEPVYAPPFVSPWAYPYGREMMPPSMFRAVLAQTVYLLTGCLFLTLWLWRQRHASQSLHLILAVLLLAVAALGSSLGFQVDKTGTVDPLLDPLLPALIYPKVAALLCGGALILAGLLDHWQLARTLGPSARMED